MPKYNKATGKWMIGDKEYKSKAAAVRSWAAYQAKKNSKKK